MCLVGREGSWGTSSNLILVFGFSLWSRGPPGCTPSVLPASYTFLAWTTFPKALRLPLQILFPRPRAARADTCSPRGDVLPGLNPTCLGRVPFGRAMDEVTGFRRGC